jgi:AcrR family transcriptional regulator
MHVAVATLEGGGIARFTTRKVASDAGTSVPAVYELFGDKRGLVRELFFEGFRQLRGRLDGLQDSTDPIADIVSIFDTFRTFANENPTLAEVMFSRPFAGFDPGPEELDAGSAVRNLVIGRVRRCVDVGLISGDSADIAQVLLAMAQGLATQGSAGWLGTSEESVNRRWALGPLAFLAGLARAERR